MQIVFGLISDNGDGSSSLRWLRNADIVDALLEDEDFYQNEGSPMRFEFPDDLDLKACGFSFDDDHYAIELAEKHSYQDRQDDDEDQDDDDDDDDDSDE